MAVQKDDWYKFCTPHLQELNPKVDLDPEVYVKELVHRAVALNSDVVVYMADEGGYPVYPSKLAPMSDHLHGIDLLGMVEKQTHKKGLRFGAGFLGMHVNSYISKEHPEWLQRDKDGNPAPMYTPPQYLVCPNSPYERYYAEYVREVLTRYDVDYIYVEGVYFARRRCYCPYCREQFRAIYGMEIPEYKGSEIFHKFCQDSVTRFHLRIKKVADEVSNRIVIAGCTYTPTTDIRTFREYVNIVSRENQWGYGGGRVSPQEAGLHMLLLKAEAKKHVMGSWFGAKAVDTDYAPRSAPHAKLTFVETLAYGATVQPHLQTLFEVDQTLMSTLAELFGCVKKVRPYLLDAHLLPYAAILHWAENKNAKSFFNMALRGYYQALMEHHIPVDAITAEDVEADRLSGYRVLVLPNARRLSKAVMEKISDYVTAGGGLVFTYCSGWFGEDGSKHDNMPLLELVGARFDGMGVPVQLPGLHYPIYYRIKSADPIWDTLRGQVLSFHGKYVSVEAAGDSEAQAQIEDLDYSRMHKDHMVEGAYPGSPIAPMIITRRVGKGRVVFITGGLDAAACRSGEPEAMEVLAKTALWAAGRELPIKTNCPPSVEIVTHTRPGSLAIFLINLATNQMGESKVIRYVVPIKDVELQVETDAPAKAVSTVRGQKVKHERKGKWLHVKLEKLHEYDVVLIDLKPR